MSFDFKENLTLYMPEIDITELAESVATDKKRIIIEIASIHSGLTANFNNYSTEELEKSLPTWVQPYPKPILKNHDMESDSMGRVMAARMDQEDDGLPFIRLQVGITGQEAIERCLDERYLTGSVGGKADSAKCSICEVDWAKPTNKPFEMPCKHQRGKIYNGKLAHLNLADLSWVEYSFVNIPADKKSSFRNIKINGSTEDTSSEEGWVKAVSFYSIDMNKESIMKFSESEEPVDMLTQMKKKEAHTTYLNIKGTFLSVSAFDYQENEEKSLNNENHTTINNEDGGLMPTQNTEENKDMTEVDEEATEDILAVADQLSEDLASPKEEEVVEETTKEKEVAEEVETEPVAYLKVYTEEDLKEEEATEKLAEEKSEEAPVEQEEVALLEEEKEEEENEVVKELNSQIEILKTENVRLKKSLHYMLAERVVDAKIAVGVMESENRSSALEDHAKRTASSLADALRDLGEYSYIAPKKSVIEIDDKSLASDKDNKFVETVLEKEEKKEIVINDAKKLENIFTDVFMGRKKLS